jgi:ribonuclease G
LPWFRRRKNESDAAAASQPAAQRVPETRPESPVVRPAAAAGAATDATTDPNRPKRRRGSRGGRGRKKPGATAGASTAATTGTAEKPDRPPQKPRSTGSGRNAGDAAKPERKQPAGKTMSQRQERRRSEGANSRRRQPPRRAPLPAAKRELLVSVDVGEQRVAVLEDDKVAEVYLERPDKRSIAGNIYLGQVDNVLPGMEAAFVEIGLEKNGFLYVDEIVGPEIERGHGRKIQDLISKGQTILVQSVKDPMKTKGARLTTQISLPGRFVVFVPQGEGLGVSRRLDDDERTRLKDILKKLQIKEGGIIVRTAAEGASEEDIERDLVFLQRLWKSIEAKAKTGKAPELIYQEAELPLRVTRDLFTGDFEKAYVDNDQAFKRITGYLKKTSPHMVERVIRYKETPTLMEAFGVDAEIRSTLSRRVDLPSGGYLIFDYAEAFTVIDVNTGRFVGGRGKNSGGRLEDTITKNNLEAVKEVVRQLRLRDIGGIIVIDFIDMANPKNRAAVEDALRTELERDRTKTYVVEISPLGLVEMTRQNVTDGPREIMTRKCPTCGGDGIVYSEASAAIDVERRIRALATGSKSQAFRIEVAAPIASALVGSGARRLIELEALTKRRFFFEGRPGVHSDHFVLLAEGKLADLAPQAPVAEGTELTIELVEVDRHDAAAAVGKLDGLDICVGEAAELVGKKVKARVERVLDGIAYATLVRQTKKAPEPLTAEAEAEKPTRKPPARKLTGAGASDAAEDGDELEPGDEAEETADDPAAARAPATRAPGAKEPAPARTSSTETEVEDDAATDAAEATGEEQAATAGTPAKKKTRRGSRGGRNRKKPAGAAAAGADADSAEAEADKTGGEAADDYVEDGDAGVADAAAEPKPSTVRTSTPRTPRTGGRSVTIHVPSAEFGRDPEHEDETEPSPPAADGAEPAENGVTPAKKKTRRGSRGGRNRKRPAGAGAAAAATNGSDPHAAAELGDEPQAFADPELVTDGEPSFERASFEEASFEEASFEEASFEEASTEEPELAPDGEPGPEPTPLPGPELDEEPVPEPEPETLEPEPAAVTANVDDADADSADSAGGDWGYVPMSEWGDDLKR